MNRFLMILITGVVLLAQEPPSPPSLPPDKDPRAIIEKIRIYELTERLNLTTEQAVKFFPRLNELRKNEENFQNQKMETVRVLQDLVRKKADDEELNKVLQRYTDARREKWVKDSLVYEEIKHLLTPRQQANLLIFQEEFEREIREMIRRVRERRPPK